MKYWVTYDSLTIHLLFDLSGISNELKVLKARSWIRKEGERSNKREVKVFTRERAKRKKDNWLPFEVPVLQVSGVRRVQWDTCHVKWQIIHSYQGKYCLRQLQCHSHGPNSHPETQVQGEKEQKGCCHRREVLNIKSKIQNVTHLEGPFEREGKNKKEKVNAIHFQLHSHKQPLPLQTRHSSYIFCTVFSFPQQLQRSFRWKSTSLAFALPQFGWGWRGGEETQVRWKWNPLLLPRFFWS